MTVPNVIKMVSDYHKNRSQDRVIPRLHELILSQGRVEELVDNQCGCLYVRYSHVHSANDFSKITGQLLKDYGLYISAFTTHPSGAVIIWISSIHDV